MDHCEEEIRIPSVLMRTTGKARRDCIDQQSLAGDEEDSITNDCSNASIIVEDDSCSVPVTPSTVRFSEVTIRAYNGTLGDNPACVKGPPITLDWTYAPEDEQTIQIDEFEKSREHGRRQQNELRLSPWTRYNLLINKWDIPIQSIKEVTDEIKQIRESRHRAKWKYLTKKQHAVSFKVLFQSIKTRMRKIKKKRRKEKQIIRTALMFGYGYKHAGYDRYGVPIHPRNDLDSMLDKEISLEEGCVPPASAVSRIEVTMLDETSSSKNSL